ncbi:hypothetical protein [Brachybacterium sacelli]|uniref:hypothetical protein n=1 Tax=Brachybacterium sacelli TaxID=173364 RepID=UPI00360E7DA0
MGTRRGGPLHDRHRATAREEASCSPRWWSSPRWGAAGEHDFRFNGTTEWALDSVEQHEAIWIPREDQLRTALALPSAACIGRATASSS